MARRDDREQAGKGAAQPPVRVDQRVSSPGWVEAAASTVRSATAAPQRRQPVGIGGRLRHVELEVAGGGDARRTERAEAFGIAADCARQRSKQRSSAPIVPGTRRQRWNERSDSRPLTRISGMRALGARDDQVRPQIGFDEQREIGPPVVEEAGDEARHVERSRTDGSRPAAGAARRARPRSRCRRCRARRSRARGCARSAGSPRAVRRRSRRAPRPAARAAAASVLSPHRSPRRVGMLLAVLEPVRQSAGASGVAAAVSSAIGAKRERQSLSHDRAAPAARSTIA